jgi:hypothetical protein
MILRQANIRHGRILCGTIGCYLFVGIAGSVPTPHRKAETLAQIASIIQGAGRAQWLAGFVCNRDGDYELSSHARQLWESAKAANVPWPEFVKRQSEALEPKDHGYTERAVRRPYRKQQQYASIPIQTTSALPAYFICPGCRERNEVKL